MSHNDETYFVITYKDVQKDEFISLRARNISDSSLGPAFIQISDFVFNESTLIVNPNEEDLKSRLKKTRSLHIALFHVVSVEEIGSDNDGLHLEGKANVVVLPTDSDSDD